MGRILDQQAENCHFCILAGFVAAFLFAFPPVNSTDRSQQAPGDSGSYAEGSELLPL